jgi:hypothetical protein
LLARRSAYPLDLHEFHDMDYRAYLSHVRRSGFDGLAWTTDPKTPRRLDGILTGRVLTRSTGLTPLNEDDDDE